MLKPILIALASLTSFDAIAWHSRYRAEVVGQVRVAVQEIKELRW